VAVDASPYQFLHGDGTMGGLDVALVRAAAEKGGFSGDLDFGPKGERATPGVLAGCPQDGRVPAGMIYCLPHRQIDLAIFKSDDSLVRGLEDLRGRRVAVLRGSVSHRHLAALGYESALVPVSETAMAFRTLREGGVEAVIIEAQRGMHALGKTGVSGIVSLSEPAASLGYGFAVANNLPELRDALERGMVVLKRTGQYQRMVGAQLVARGEVVPAGPGLGSTVYAYALWAVLPLGLLLAASIVNYLSLRQRALQRIAELESKLGSVRSRSDHERAQQARQKFVINRVSTVSLVDQLLSVSRSKDEKQPQELGA
jgi:hypothetical protein